MRPSRLSALAVSALGLITALALPGNAATTGNLVTLSGARNTSVDVTLPRSTIGDGSLVTQDRSQYVGIVVESLTQHRFVSAFVKLRNSIGVIGESTEPVRLPAGRYRLHLVSYGASASASLRIAGAAAQRLTTSRRSPVKAALSPLTTVGQAAGRFTGKLRLGPGGLTLLGYRVQALATPAGVIDLGLYLDTPATDPNGLFPQAGFRPLPFASTFSKGAEALVWVSLAQAPVATTVGAYRQEVNVATAAVTLRNSEVFTLTTG